MSGKAKRTVTIKSSGGVTRAVNGDVAPEPSRLRPDTGSVEGRFRALRPPTPPQSVLEAILTERAKLGIRSSTGRPPLPPPRAPTPDSPSSAPPPPRKDAPLYVPPPRRRVGPFVSGTETCQAPPLLAAEVPDHEPKKRLARDAFPEAVAVSFPLAFCRVCKLFPETFACWPCKHSCACFACAEGLKTCSLCNASAVSFYRTSFITFAG